MTTFKLQFCEEGSFLVVDDSTGKEVCQYALSPESTYAILDVIGNVLNCAEPITGNKIALVDIVPEAKAKPKKKKGKDNDKK
jgi:hypothetical protein